MKVINIDSTLDISVSKAWDLFTNLNNYPKYFKYVNYVFHKGEMKLGSTWYDFATFVAPVVVKHKTTVFEKEKALGFDISLPFGGFVIERINFENINGKTKILGKLEFDFKIFNFLEPLFEKRMNESINIALNKVKKDL